MLERPKCVDCRFVEKVGKIFRKRMVCSQARDLPEELHVSVERQPTDTCDVPRHYYITDGLSETIGIVFEPRLEGAVYDSVDASHKQPTDQLFQQ